MLFIQRNHVVQAFTTNHSHQSLAVAFALGDPAGYLSFTAVNGGFQRKGLIRTGVQ